MIRAVARVAVLLTVVGPAIGHGSANNETTPMNGIEEKPVAAVAVVDGEARREEAGRKEDSPTSRPAKRFGWKNGYRSTDSYLEALRHSRTSNDPREGVVGGSDGPGTAGQSPGSAAFQRRKEYAPGPIYAANESEGVATAPRIVHGSTDRDSFSFAPSDSYSLPTRTSGNFREPQSSYGPPQPQPPRGSYGPAAGGYSSYGEYSPPQQAYGPPSSNHGSAAPYGHGISELSLSLPHAIPTVDFSWPFALKLNAFTLAKILLKLVIFKMIVKFIAVICLLLFIPKLEIKKVKKGGANHQDNDDDDDDEDDESRRLIDPDSWIMNRVNVLAAIASNAVDKYDRLNGSRSNIAGECTTLPCRARAAPTRDETRGEYARLLRAYAFEETRPPLRTASNS